MPILLGAGVWSQAAWIRIRALPLLLCGLGPASPLCASVSPFIEPSHPVVGRTDVRKCTEWCPEHLSFFITVMQPVLTQLQAASGLTSAPLAQPSGHAPPGGNALGLWRVIRGAWNLRTEEAGVGDSGRCFGTERGRKASPALRTGPLD